MTSQLISAQTTAGINVAMDGHKLSFIIRVSGEIVAAMPDEEEFSPQQIRDFVAGTPELLCQTHDGFCFFQNRNGKERGLPLNTLATRMFVRTTNRSESLLGRILLAHSDHIAAYWKGAVRGN